MFGQQRLKQGFVIRVFPTFTCFLRRTAQHSTAHHSFHNYYFTLILPIKHLRSTPSSSPRFRHYSRQCLHAHAINVKLQVAGLLNAPPLLPTAKSRTETFPAPLQPT